MNTVKNKKTVKTITAVIAMIATCALIATTAFAAISVPKQSKSNWCWATAALKTIVANDSTWNVPSDYVKVNSASINTAQEYIVYTYNTKNITGPSNDNKTDSASAIIDAVYSETGNSLTEYGQWKTKPFADATTRADIIDNHLSSTTPVIANAYNASGSGHSVVILSRSGSNYTYWDPAKDSSVTQSASILFSTGFSAAGLSGLIIENAVYFD